MLIIVPENPTVPNLIKRYLMSDPITDIARGKLEIGHWKFEASSVLVADCHLILLSQTIYRFNTLFQYLVGFFKDISMGYRLQAYIISVARGVSVVIGGQTWRTGKWHMKTHRFLI